MALKKKVLFLEVEGGSDKGDDGHRRDTMPMIEGLREEGWEADVKFYSDEKRDEIYELAKGYDAYVSRVNPGSLKDETKYLQMLRDLSDKEGVYGMSHPEAQTSYGAKDALVKLNQTGLVPEDTYSYYDTKIFHEKFPETLKLGERVLKQNRGSTGEGIWRVVVSDKRDFSGEDKLPLDTEVKCTEAKDNHVEIKKLGEFMEFCNQYIVGDNGMLVDMKFLPRIKEGEIRILMLYNKPVFVVHKKPADAEDAFSATLFSGAKYTYEEPSKWPDLIKMFEEKLPLVMKKLGGYDYPLIWTADWILDWGENKEDIYILGEMNCSCVGFTSQLDMAPEVSKTIIHMLELNEKKKTESK